MCCGNIIYIFLGIECMVVRDRCEGWDLFLDCVKSKCSSAAFGNWFAPIRLIESTDQELVLEVPNIFVQEYLLSNYKKELCAFLPTNRHGDPAIRFTITPAVKKEVFHPRPATEATSSNSDSRGSRSREVFAAQQAKLNNNYRFENFIEGSANQFVKSAAVGTALRPAQVYNPLFIHGGVGLGKTHILHSIGHSIREKHSKLRIQCITTEAFINDLVDHLRNKSIDRMKRYYRSEIDVLLVDDIQFLESRLNFEEELALTFEALKNKGGQIVITSDKPPSLLKLSERMISKMEGGLVAHMEVPDLETRVAILQYKAERKGLHIPQRVAFFIADHIHHNVRQIEGAINRLSAHCCLMNLNITEEMVSKTLSEILQSTPRERVSVEQILKSVASVFQVKVSDLKGNNRTKDITLPRQVAMYLAKEMINESLIMLGSSFGKTHSTILHACKTIQKKVAEDEALRQQISVIRRSIEA